MAAATAVPPNAQPAGLARWTPTLPPNGIVGLVNMINPFATTDDTNPAHAKPEATTNASTDDSLIAPATSSKRPILSAVQLQSTNSQPQASPSRSSSSIMFAEPESRSSDGGSREGSIDGRRAKKTTRPKTQFSICHPPPESKALQKLHRRPRSLLQLHKLSDSARPRPALDVIPSANFSVKLTRAITRVFKAKHGLCPNDLVILKAEKYSTEEADEDQEARDVIGIICRGRINGEDKQAGKVKIHTASGVEWEASPAVNGGYEFFSTDEHGLGMTVRWWPKRKKENSKTTSKEGKRRFNFSTISPSSRRHPVIASLSSTGLDINDSYKIPEPAAVTPLSSPMYNATFESSFDDDNADEESLDDHWCETDDKLREIISLTAIFVAFKEGWSPNFKYDDKESGSPVKPGSSTLNSPPISPPPFALEKRHSIKSISSGIIRRSSVLSRSNRSSTASVPELEEPAEDIPRSASFSRTGRSRANSTNTVLVHRAASNRRKHNSQPAWRPDVLPAQDPLEEVSREDLSRDFPNPMKSSSPLAQSDGMTSEPDETVAIPLIPDADTGSGATSPAPRTRRPVDDLDIPKGHRESATASYASTSSSPVAKSSPTHKVKTVKKKRSGWRRVMLCGSRSSEE